jgi:hypothetical protein
LSTKILAKNLSIKPKNYWYGQLTTFSLIFDALSKFGVKIDQKVHFGAFLKKFEVDFFDIFKKNCLKS